MSKVFKPGPGWGIGAAASIVCALAWLLRLRASSGDFWLDEIWTWSIASQLRSSWDVLTRIHHENNHHLNTWIMYLLGKHADWRVYRFPAVVAGAGTVLVAGLSGWRRDRVDSLLVMILTGSSYLLIHYSSEARGYSYVLFFSMLSYALMRRAIEEPPSAPSTQAAPPAGTSPRSTRAVFEGLFALSAVGGFLSQPIFIYCYASLAIWWAHNCSRCSFHRREVLASALRCHLLPSSFLMGLYIVDLRHAVNAGGPILRLSEVVVDTLSLAVGGPEDGRWAMAAAAVTAVACTVSIALLRRAGDDSWIFFSLVTLVAPLSIVLILKRQEVYPRYFLIAVLFQLLLMSRLLSHLVRCGSWGRAACVAFVFGLLVANGIHTERLMYLGRGSYLDALRRMQARTSGPEMTVGSDHDFRNSMVIDFYRPYLSTSPPLRYYTQDRWPPGGPEWVLLHSQEHLWQPPQEVSDLDHNRYALQRVYRYAGLSGWHWAVYRNTRIAGGK